MAKQSTQSPEEKNQLTPEQEAAKKAAEQEKKDAANKAASKEKAEKEAKEKAEAFEKSEKIDILKKTKDNFVPKPGTEGNYHVRMEKKSFNAQSGERLSRPHLQVFAPKAWDNFEKNAIGLGYHVDILHDPTGKYPVVGMQKAIDERKKAEKEKEAKK